MSESKIKIVSRAIGRRKESVATARIFSGDGTITVNQASSTAYFPDKHFQVLLQKPFNTISAGKYSASVKVIGGGKNGQLEAVMLAISRALAGIKNEYKTSLRSASLLTRDSRERQRRMVGTGGKARRRKQSPKR